MAQEKFVIFLILSLAFLGLSSCTNGYARSLASWDYVTINEGNGKSDTFVSGDLNKFRVLENRKFAVDSENVYFEGRRILGADPSSFHLVGKFGIAIDSRNVYVERSKVEIADVSSFEMLGGPYWKDKKRVFCGNLPLIGANPTNFKVIETENGPRWTYQLRDFFIKENPQYQSIVSLLPEDVIITGYGIAESGSTRYSGITIVSERFVDNPGKEN
jgi:hypothetical protein